MPCFRTTFKKNGVNLYIKYKNLSKLNKRQPQCTPIKFAPGMYIFLIL